MATSDLIVVKRTSYILEAHFALILLHHLFYVQVIKKALSVSPNDFSIYVKNLSVSEHILNQTIKTA